MLHSAIGIASIGMLSLSANAQSVWKKLPVGDLRYHASAATRPFMDFRDHVKLPASRMAGNGSGGLFLSDDSVYWASSDNGESWHSRTLSPPPGYGIGQGKPPAPFFVGPGGAVQWGIGWYSWDRGETWEYRPSAQPAAFLREAPAILQAGPTDFLASYPNSQDGIRNSKDSGLTWKDSHELDYYFPVLQFEAPDPHWVFAAGAQLLISRDQGLSWKKSGPVSDGLFPYKISSQKTTSGWVLWGIYDSATVGGDGTVHSPKLLRYPSSGAPESKPLALPDSSLTAFRAQDDGTLWLGTWGKGIFSSSDQGTHWTARNEGLGDLRIETLYRAPDGSLFAITPDGTYRLDSASSTSADSARNRKGYASPGWPPRALFRLPGSPPGRGLDGRIRRAGSIPISR